MASNNQSTVQNSMQSSLMQPSPIRLALVGAGYWGPNLLRNLLDLPECQVLAVCDRDPDRLAYIQNLYGSRLALCQNYEALLADPSLEGVVLATGIETHARLIEAALQAGKHVLVEKPMATKSADCQRLGQLAEQQGKVLMVDHTYLYNPALLQLKQIVDSGMLGQVYYLHAKRVNLGRVQTQFNALWSLAIHDISMTLHLFDELPERVQAWGHGFIHPQVQDVAFLNMTFPSGRMAHVHASWLDPEKKRQLTLVGSQKMVVYNDVSTDRKLTIFDKGVDRLPTQDNTPEFKDFGEFQFRIRSGDIHIPHVHFTEPLKQMCQHFLACIAQAPLATPKTGWQAAYSVVRVLEAAEQSLQANGQPVLLDWPINSQAYLQKVSTQEISTVVSA